jgi:uncharacterized protein
MPKRVFIIHREGASPDDDWYQWLKGMLVERNFQVFVPKMPDTNEPHISSWVPYLSELVAAADKQTYFVGHGIGCQAILRYLETLERTARVGGAVFIAGWFRLMDGSIKDEKQKKIAMEWESSPIDFQLVRDHLDQSLACFSDNDPFVPLSESKIFEAALGSKVIIHPKRGHFTKADGVYELHIALNEILKFAK